MLTKDQIDKLHGPVTPGRVAKHPSSGMSYLKTWDVIAQLGKIFGLDNWDDELSYGLIFEDNVTWSKNGQEKSGWDVAYHAKCVLTLRDSNGEFVCSKSGAATGSATHQPSRADAHDLAIKDATSDALKRAATKLGNQFGLSLYDNGSTKSVLGFSLAHPVAEGTVTALQAKFGAVVED